MNEPDTSFFSRWSRRKALVREAAAPVAQPIAPDAAPTVPVAASVPNEPMAPAAAAAVSDEARAPELQPTLDEAQALTPESDFSRFVSRDVDPQVKNLAMKKLFADPHFNVMDGLDTYIDDYNTPDPLPKAMLRQLVQARMLGLLDDELEDQAHLTRDGNPGTTTGTPDESSDAAALGDDDAVGASPDQAPETVAALPQPNTGQPPELAGGEACDLDDGGSVPAATPSRTAT